jgi:hypothetical protein
MLCGSIHLSVHYTPSIPPPPCTPKTNTHLQVLHAARLHAVRVDPLECALRHVQERLQLKGAQVVGAGVGEAHGLLHARKGVGVFQGHHPVGESTQNKGKRE